MSWNRRSPARVAVLALTALAVAGFTVAAAQGQSYQRRALVPASPATPFTIESQTAPVFRALPRTQAVPIQNVVSFETEFTRRLNEAIRFSAAAKETTIVHTKVWKNIVDTTVFKHADHVATQLSPGELQQLRTLINRRIDQAVADELAGRAGLASLGGGVISNAYFTGRIRPADRFVGPGTGWQSGAELPRTEAIPRERAPRIPNP